MMAKIAKIAFLNAVILFLMCHNAVADLPIHGTLSDMVGKWRLEISKEVKGVNINCGSDVPNSLEGDLKLGDYRPFMSSNFGLGESLDLELSLDPVKFSNVTGARNRENWISLAVKSDGKVVGSWTAVYDQGFHVNLFNGTSIIIYFSFEKIEDNKYATHTDRSFIGWVTREENGTTKHYCCYAEKLTPQKQGVLNTVDMTSTTFDRFRKEVMRTMRNGGRIFSPVNDQSWDGYKSNYFCTCSNQGQSAAASSQQLPKNFSWDKFDNIPLVDQKRCGACYTIASLYVLQSRFLIKVRNLLEQANREPDARLVHLEKMLREKIFDINNTLSCMVYNQGCKGGYPLNVGRYAKSFGILLDEPASGEIADTEVCPSSDGADSLRLFAKDSGYVGGCYQCTQCNGERLIMDEIYNNGPVVVGIDGGYIRHYRDGIVDPPESELRKHHGMCEFPDNKFLSGFEYTTHAVTLIGWGESDEGFKYWLARNSWGKDWGDHGYFKLVRGKNAFGVESEAVFIDPDVDRVLANTKQAPIRSHSYL